MSTPTPGRQSNLLRWLNSERAELARTFLAEFVGTALLVIFTCGTCVTSGGNLVATSLSFGLTLLCLVAVLGHVSGTHVNPAVTIGLLVDGQIQPIKAGLYLVAQVLGASAGAAVLAGILGGTDNLCVTALASSTSPFQGVIFEAVIVFLFVATICNVCESNAQLAPIIIGLALTTGHLLAIPRTGSSMNPARSFGPALISGSWDNHWVYWVGPIIGGALGGAAHRWLFVNKSIYQKVGTTTPPPGEPANVTTAI